MHGQADTILVTYGDTPLLRSETLQGLVALFEAQPDTGNLALAMLTVTRDDPQGFGRIVRDASGAIRAYCRRGGLHAGTGAHSRKLNPAIYCFDAAWLWATLPQITQSAKGEFTLTDLVGMAVRQGRRVVAMPAPVEEVDGINTRVHLAHATGVLRQRILERHMLAGVTIIDPATTYIEEGVQIGMDTTVMPGCLLQGKTEIGRRCVIGPYSTIRDSVIADECRVFYAIVENARHGS